VDGAHAAVLATRVREVIEDPARWEPKEPFTEPVKESREPNKKNKKKKKKN